MFWDIQHHFSIGKMFGLEGPVKTTRIWYSIFHQVQLVRNIDSSSVNGTEKCLPSLHTSRNFKAKREWFSNPA